MLNANTATILQFKGLPGVTAEAATAAVTCRTTPYANAADLSQRIKPLFFPPSAVAELTFASPSVAAVASPAKAPVPAPASPAPTLAHGDIANLLNLATGPVSLPKGSYTCNSAVILRFPVEANGSTIVCPKLPNNASNIRLSTPGVSFDNAILPQGGVLFEYAANACRVSNCQIGVGQPAGSVVQAFKTITGGTNPAVSNCCVGITQSVSAYFDRGRRIVNGQPVAGDPGVCCENMTLQGSVDEYVLRLEVASGGADNGVKQSGANLIDCTLTNGTRKDTVGVRVFDDATFSGGAITGDVRIGQVPAAGGIPTSTVGQYCNGINFKGISFTSDGSPESAVEAYEGVIASVIDCTFTGYAVPPVCAGTLSQVTTQNNIQRTAAGQHAPEFFAASSRGKHVALGGDKQVTA